MVSCSLHPREIEAGRPCTLVLRLRNTGGGFVTGLHADLLFPAPLRLISGQTRIEHDLLAPGEQFELRLLVMADQPGPCAVTVRSLHFFDENGEKVKHSGISLAVEAVRAAPALPPWIEISEQALQLGQWGALEGTLHCPGRPLPPGARLFSDPPLACDQPYVLPEGAQDSARFTLRVRPTQSGEVPVRFRLCAASGSQLFAQVVTVRVAPPPGPRSVTVIGSANIADTIHIQQEFVPQEPPMIPIDVLLAALAAAAKLGLEAATSAVVEDAVKQSYARLKSLLHHRLEGHDGVKHTVKRLQEDVQSPVWRAAVKEELEKLALDRDQELLRAAQAFLEAADPDGKASHKYHIDARGSTGTNINLGDNTSITQHFHGKGSDE